LSTATNVANLYLNSKNAGARLQLPRKAFSIRIGRVDEKRDAGCRWRYLMHNLKLLRCELCGEIGHASDIIAWPTQAADETDRNRVNTCHEHDRNGHAGRFCLPRSGCARCGNHVHRAMDQIGCQRRQAIILSVGPAVFNCHVPPDVTRNFVQPLIEGTQPQNVRLRRPGTEPSDDRRSRPLSTRRQRPRSRCADKRNDEIPPSNSDCHRTLPRGGLWPLDHVICGYLTLGIMTRPISVSEIRSVSLQSSDIGGARRCAECRPPGSPPAAHPPPTATSPCRPI